MPKTSSFSVRDILDLPQMAKNDDSATATKTELYSHSRMTSSLAELARTRYHPGLAANYMSHYQGLLDASRSSQFGWHHLPPAFHSVHGKPILLHIHI